MSTLQLPLRPNDQGGSKGKLIKVKTNIFPVTALGEITVFQYEVLFHRLKENALLERSAWKAFEKYLRKEVDSDCLMVFDGRKTAYSAKKINSIENAEITFTRPDEIFLDPINPQGGRGRGYFPPPTAVHVVRPKPGEDKSKKFPMTWNISLKQTSEINLAELLRLARGQTVQSDVTLHGETALSVLLRHVPSMLFTPIGPNFFTPKDRQPITGGLEIWHGYHQSVRPMQNGKLGVNIDLAAASFVKGDISVIDYLMESLGVSNPNDLASNSRAASNIQKTLKGIFVATMHRGEMIKRHQVKRISRLSAREYKFNKHSRDEGAEPTEITVEEYYRVDQNISLQFPNLPLIEIVMGKEKRVNAIPLEFFKIIAGQQYRSKLNGAQTSDMIRATVQKPYERMRMIEGSKAYLKYEGNEHLKSFGMSVSPNMMDVSARILPSPRVLFNDNRALSGDNGQWNLRGLRLVNAPELRSYAFVFFVRVSERTAKEVRDALINKWTQAGLNIPRGASAPVVITNPGRFENLQGALKVAFKEASQAFNHRCQMIFCIVDGDRQTYENIKRTSLCEAGVLTQCLAFNNVKLANTIKDQYAANVALKINVKLGGATNYIQSSIPKFFDGTTMFVGIAISHAGAGSASPSIVALVASMDRQSTVYHTFLREQTHRIDLVEDLKPIILEAVDSFRQHNNVFPSRIVVFREGISGGQFAQCIETEVKSINEACAERQFNAPVTFFSVQKRHHIRFFPIDGNKDRSENCLPGTVVSTEIVHPKDFQFYLQSHAGIQGMSRPTNYHVIHDENHLSSDEAQQLCYELCFLAERATRSIAMVAPTYRATIAATYARMFMEGNEFSDKGSLASGGLETQFKFRNVLSNIQKTMYYM